MNRLQYLLGKLAEEASEVAKAALKAQQFGFNSWNPDNLDAGSNATQLCVELNDVGAIVRMLNEEYKLGFEVSLEEMEDKRVRVNKYALMSEVAWRGL